MTTETPTNTASTENRLAARQWVEAFNARDNKREADARTADYIAHAPDSMHLPALDSDTWAAVLPPNTGSNWTRSRCSSNSACDSSPPPTPASWEKRRGTRAAASRGNHRECRLLIETPERLTIQAVRRATRPASRAGAPDAETRKGL
jgi:hypothetical protein